MRNECLLLQPPSLWYFFCDSLSTLRHSTSSIPRRCLARSRCSINPRRIGCNLIFLFYEMQKGSCVPGLVTSIRETPSRKVCHAHSESLCRCSGKWVRDPRLLHCPGFFSTPYPPTLGMLPGRGEETKSFRKTRPWLWQGSQREWQVGQEERGRGQCAQSG